MSGLAKTTGDASDDEDESVYLATALDVLANERRQHVIEAVAATDDSITVRELSYCVTAREDDCDPDNLDRHDVKSVYVTLTGRQLNLLADVGAVEFSETPTMTVAPDANFEAFASYLDEGERRFAAEDGDAQ